MSIRRNGTPRKRVLDHRFPIPFGTDAFEYEEPEEDDEGDNDDEDDDEFDEDKKKKRKKKKKKRKKKRKGKRKGKGKRKKRGKGRKKRKDKKDKKDDKGGDKKTNTPKSFEVVKQTIRTKADGSQVVDLTVDVDKINRADKYEFRVVRKDNGNVKLVTDN